MKRATFFKPAGSSSPEQAKAPRQSIRGRISAPIPMPDPLEPNDYPAPDPLAGAYAPHQEPAIPEEEPPARDSSPPPEPSAVPQDPEIPEPDADPSVELAGEDGPEPINEPPAVEISNPTEPTPSLHSPTVRPVAGSPADQTQIPTLEQPPSPPQEQQQQQQPRYQQQPQYQQQSPYRPQQAQPASLIQPVQQLGPSPSPASAGPSASASASGSASAGNSAASPAFRHRTNASSTLRYSETSGLSAGGADAGSSTKNTVSGNLKPQRKTSTLRGALSKLFGRRKKVNSQVLPPIASQGHDMVPQHRSVRSDPTVLGRPRDGDPKRSASLPITEYDRALRSHSIGPEDVAAIESARNSFQVDRGSGNLDASGGRRRAATSTNRILFPEQGRRRFGNNSADVLSSAGEWTGLSPRPASAHGRGSSSRLSGFIIGSSGGDGGSGLGKGLSSSSGGAGHGGASDPNEIGRAITSDVSGANDFSSRRRSRSLSGLTDIAFDQAQSRRRSGEIRYWRESYDPAFLSPLSSGQGMDIDDDAETEDRDDRDDHVDDDEDQGIHQGHDSALTDKENFIVFDDGDDNAGAASLLQSLPDSPVGQQEEQQNEQQQRLKTPPQPFPFGNLSSLGTASGSMKITQANSMDSRIGGLETRMSRMERVVDQLSHSVPGFKGPLAASSVPADQVPRSVPPFPHQVSSYTPAASSGGQPAIPPIPAIYQSQAANLKASIGPAGDPYSPIASSSRYSNSRHSGHSGHSFDSDVHSHMSFGDGQTYIGSLHPPSSSATQTQSILAPAGGPGSTLSPGDYSPALRPTSTSTVRGATSLPTLGAAGDSTADLIAQLESERAVRQTLETQVKKLNERVNALSTTMYAMLRDPAAKPRGSRDPLLSPSSSNLREQSAAAAAASTAATQLKAESVLMTAKALGHGVSADVETESEGFQTPTEDVREEDRNYNYTDDNNNDTGKNDAAGGHEGSRRQKKAARTLSLGQLTLGKSPVHT